VVDFPSILKAQQSDPFCIAARNLLRGVVLPLQHVFTNALARLKSELFVDSGTDLLMRRFVPSNGPRRGHALIVMILPESLVKTTLHNLHATPGHHGKQNMVWHAQTRFYFFKMYDRIAAFVKQCTVCQRSHTDKRPAPLGHIPSRGYMDTVGIDFAGPFQAVGTPGSQYIGIVVDHHSKFIWVVPTVSTTAADAISVLVEFIEVVGTFPKRVVSDRGSFAISAVWQQVLREFGMEPTLVTSYNPQANGATEAQVKNVKRILKKVIQDHPTAYDKACKFAAFSYNQSYHSTIGTSPYFVAHGRHPRTTTDIQLADVNSAFNPPTSMNELACMQASVDRAVCEAIQALGDSYTARNASLRRHHTFAVDDLVYLHRVYPDSFAKAGIDTAFFMPFHQQLFQVTAVLSPQVCLIRDSTVPTAIPFSVHVQRLKPSTPRRDALFYEDFSDPHAPVHTPATPLLPSPPPPPPSPPLLSTPILTPPLSYSPPILLSPPSSPPPHPLSSFDVHHVPH